MLLREFGAILFLTSSALLSSCSIISVEKVKSYANSERYIVGNQTYEGAIHTLNVDWNCGGVTIIENDSITEISVVENNNLEDDKKVHTYFEDGVLNVKFWKSGKTSTVNSADKHVIITVPLLETINIQSKSGKISAESLQASNIDIMKTSGTLEVGTLKSDLAEIDSTSGSIKINSVDVKALTIDSTSGLVDLNNIKVQSLNMNQTSGHAKLGLVEASTVSLTKTSGSSEIVVPDTGATISVSKTSGSFLCQKEHIIKNNKYVIGEGKTLMSLTYTSGSCIVV